jgi:phage repressor protein C with HTH and peptisase S24 domain
MDWYCQAKSSNRLVLFMDEFYSRLMSLKQTTEKNKDFVVRIGASVQSLNLWMHGKIPSREKLELISDATGVSIDWLLTGKEEQSQSIINIKDHQKTEGGEYHPHKDPYEYFGQVDKWDGIELCPIGHAQKVPVVGTVEAGGFQVADDGDYPVGIANEYVYTDSKTNGIFALTVSNDSMEPKFQEGDILLINPNIEPQSGDFVVAKYTPDNEATFKQLIIHHRTEKGTIVMEIILHPLNEKYDDIHVEEPGLLKIVGKVVEKKVFY